MDTKTPQVGGTADGAAELRARNLASGKTEEGKEPEYKGDPMQPNPTLLRRIAKAIAGNEAAAATDPLVGQWAKTFTEHYPE